MPVGHAFLFGGLASEVELLPEVAATGQVRRTEEGDRRVTEEGDVVETD